MCGGTIIQRRLILLAASCLVKSGLDYHVTHPRNIQITVGQSDGKMSYPRRTAFAVAVKIHELYRNDGLYQHDIALILLEEAFGYTRYIQPACLPLTETMLHEGEKIVNVGSGKGMRRDVIPKLYQTNPCLLQNMKGEIGGCGIGSTNNDCFDPFKTIAECDRHGWIDKDVHSWTAPMEMTVLKANHCTPFINCERKVNYDLICYAGTKCNKTCAGDQGGGGMHGNGTCWTIISINSFLSREDCTGTGYVDGGIRVARHLHWIRRHMADYSLFDPFLNLPYENLPYVPEPTGNKYYQDAQNYEEKDRELNPDKYSWGQSLLSKVSNIAGCQGSKGRSSSCLRNRIWPYSGKLNSKIGGFCKDVECPDGLGMGQVQIDMNKSAKNCCLKQIGK